MSIHDGERKLAEVYLNEFDCTVDGVTPKLLLLQWGYDVGSYTEDPEAI